MYHYLLVWYVKHFFYKTGPLAFDLAKRFSLNKIATVGIGSV